MVVEALVAIGAIGLLTWAFCADAPWLERHAHEYRCLRDAALVSKVRVLRVVATGAALALLFFVRARLGRLAAKATLAGALRIGLAVVLALAVVEVIQRKPW